MSTEDGSSKQPSAVSTVISLFGKLVLNQQSVFHSEVLGSMGICNTPSTDLTTQSLLIFQPDNCIFLLMVLPNPQACQTREIDKSKVHSNPWPRECFFLYENHFDLTHHLHLFLLPLKKWTRESNSKFFPELFPLSPTPETTLKVLNPAHQSKVSNQLFSYWFPCFFLSSVLSSLGCFLFTWNLLVLLSLLMTHNFLKLFFSLYIIVSQEIVEL